MLYSIFIAAALSLASRASAQSSTPGQPCGLKIAPCSEDTECVPDSPDCTDLDRCPGTCEFINTYPFCGGNTPYPRPCDKGSSCEDDSRYPDSCGQACDAPGICIPDDVPACGGFAGFSCPEGLFCYDLIFDGCDPKAGGADCIGVCL